jgi:hypothetical protein
MSEQFWMEVLVWIVVFEAALILLLNWRCSVWKDYCQQWATQRDDRARKYNL